MEVKIINSWAGVTLEKYQQIVDIQQNELLEAYEKDLQVVALLRNITEDELNAMPLTKIKEMVNHVAFISEPIPEVSLRDVYEVNGVKYKLTRKVTDLTGRDFITLTTLMQDGQKLKEDFYSTLHEIVAVLMQRLVEVKQPRLLSFLKRKPVYKTEIELGKNPDDIDSEAISNDMLQLPIVDINAISNFFLSLSNHLLGTFISCNKSQVRNQIQSALKTLEQKKNPSKKDMIAIRELQALLNNGISFT